MNFDELKPYKTAHEKLIEMGYECEDKPIQVNNTPTQKKTRHFQLE